MSFTIDNPINYYPQFDRFGTVGGGELYIGVVDGDPANVPADRIQVYMARQNDTDLAIPQPIELSPGGVPMYNGSAITIKNTGVEFSMQVIDRQGQQVYYSPKSGEIAAAILVLQAAIADLEARTPIVVDTYADIATLEVEEGQIVITRGHTYLGMGSNTFIIVPSAGLTANGGTISPTATAGLYAKSECELTPVFFGANIDDDSIDDLAAFQDLFQVAELEDRGIIIPDSLNYYVSEPLTAYKGLRISGIEEISASPDDGGSGAKIYAPNGFLLATERVSIYVSNLYIYGNSSVLKYGIDGPIGGVISGCHFTLYERLINNNFAYFLSIVRCRFGTSDIGVALAVANSTDIIDCFFASDCEVKVDSGFTLASFDGITNSGGAPLNIRDCGFNINTPSGSVVIKHKGSGDISSNYFEVFSGAGAGKEMIHWQPRRDAYDTINCNDNRISNQGACDRFLRIWSDNALGTVTAGEVKRNLIRGCTAKPFIFGDPSALSNPLVSGIDISSNNYNTVDQIDYTSVYNYFSPQIQASYTGTLNIAGAAFINVPLVIDAGSLGGEVSGDDVYPRVPGRYAVTATVVIQTTALDYADVQARLRFSGVEIDVARTGITYNAATSYATLTMCGSAEFTIASFVELQARQGQNLISAKVTIRRER
jgi:hypothetical protein